MAGQVERLVPIRHILRAEESERIDLHPLAVELDGGPIADSDATGLSDVDPDSSSEFPSFQPGSLDGPTNTTIVV